MAKTSFSPKKMLRARRPEHFSDSTYEETPSPHRSLLEYHLDTLTSRSQEKDFEDFARHLAEYELCPNLASHTGPDAGGDSKADTETYPVAEGLREICYWGWGDAAATERWAVAVSTQKTWKAKVAGDVKKIVATGRGYKKVFFISSQAIRDKERAGTEDKLKKAHGIDVRIFDRTWILDKVFGNGHENLAIQDLHLPDSISKSHVIGPRDAEREKELEEVEDRIRKSAASADHNLSTVEDCLRAASLVRSLEKPREQVDGCYARAVRISDRYGTPHHRIRARYDHCWATYFWHEDADTAFSLYSEVEDLALSSDNIYDIELLSNLRNILNTAVHLGSIDDKDIEMKARTDRLVARLAEMSSLDDRPSAALQARSIALLISITDPDQKTAKPVFDECRTIVEQADQLMGFPLQSLSDVIIEIGDVYGDSPGYEELYEIIINVHARRSNDKTAASMIIRRAQQQYRKQKFGHAIRSLGRALVLLFKDETRELFLHALDLCGSAYAKLGLPWAARGTMLHGAYIAMSDFWKYSAVDINQTHIIRKIKWIELELGRLAPAISWYRLELFLTKNSPVKLDELREDGELPEQAHFDGCLSILILRSSLDQLKVLTRLPATLDDLGMGWSALSLRYALGDTSVHEDVLSSPDPRTVDELDDELLKHFTCMVRQPGANSLPERPEIYNEARVEIKGAVLGCLVTIDSVTREPAITVSEAILAGIQAFLAIGLIDRVMPMMPSMTVAVNVSEKEPDGVSARYEEVKGRLHVTVTASPFDPHLHSIQLRHEIVECISRIIIHMVSYGFMIDNLDETVVPWFRDDDIMSRAVGVTSGFGTMTTIFGNDYGSAYKNRIQDLVGTSSPEYELLRTQPWHALIQETVSKGGVKMTPGKGEAPPDLRMDSGTSHSEISVYSLIRIPLWNRSDWSGAGFAIDPLGSRIPPTLALVFGNEDVGQEIFACFREDVGPVDLENRLRVVIIRGVSCKNMHAYRILIGSNIPDTLDAGKKFFVSVCRFKEMAPDSSRNIDLFLERYQRDNRYMLTCSTMKGGTLEVCFECGLIKRDLVVKWAYEIGLNDLDGTAISADDEVYLPPGNDNAPIHELIARKKAKGQ